MVIQHNNQLFHRDNDESIYIYEIQLSISRSKCIVITMPDKISSVKFQVRFTTQVFPFFFFIWFCFSFALFCFRFWRFFFILFWVYFSLLLCFLFCFVFVCLLFVWGFSLLFFVFFVFCFLFFLSFFYLIFFSFFCRSSAQPLDLSKGCWLVVQNESNINNTSIELNETRVALYGEYHAPRKRQLTTAPYEHQQWSFTLTLLQEKSFSDSMLFQKTSLKKFTENNNQYLIYQLSKEKGQNYKR